MKALLTIVFFTMLSSSNCFAQRDELGVNIGYGKSYFGDPQLFPFQNNNFDSYKIGCSYYHTPVKAPFSFCTSISYIHNQSEDAKIDFIDIPFGLQLDLGKRIHFMAGSSLNAKFLIHYNQAAKERVSNHEERLNRTQLAWSFWGGLGYRINEKVDLSFTYINTSDITNLYTIQKSSPGGAKYDLIGKSSIGLINCSLKFTLNKKDK